MEEIKVGEYVRTPGEGYIGKLIGIIPNVLNYYVIDCNRKVRKDNFPENYLYFRDGCGLKHSFNIIDLIEEGDYVNGYYCRRIPDFGNKMCNFDLNTMEWTPLENIDIWYNVVTKEQFQSMEYRLEE